jgi:hypothetical protein
MAEKAQIIFDYVDIIGFLGDFVANFSTCYIYKNAQAS